MKIFYLFRRLIFRIKESGFKNTLHEMIFFKRMMIVIEKEIILSKKGIDDQGISFIDVDNSNFNNYQSIDRAPSFKYYCKKGAKCIIAVRNNRCIGYQWWIQDNQFIDIKKLELTMESNEAYLFDLFVYPELRGSNAPKIISDYVLDYLAARKINKIFGFYFGDNIKALWWHRAVLKCREIKRAKIHRILFFEFVNGKLFLNL